MSRHARAGRPVRLRILDVIGEGPLAAVRFENGTPSGVVESCDWVRVEDGLIREARSYYEPTPIRAVLAPSDQDGLGGASA